MRVLTDAMIAHIASGVHPHQRSTAIRTARQDASDNRALLFLGGFLVVFIVLKY